ncbi:MAG: DUF4911 domain-containing protein [Candidatus Schekmanbacteria bacterium]|nr:MAG: DUF4911 domain-containing protein [Candidatus Schekmanbacteria bacterium]
MHFHLLKVRAKINREDIVFFSWLIESYEEIAVMRTIDSNEGIVEFWVSPFLKEDFKEIIESVDEPIEFIGKSYLND